MRGVALFILCTVTAILSILPLGSALEEPDYLARLAANSNRVVLTALVEFVWALSAAGIVIALYPVICKYNRALAVSAVAGRVVEGAFVLLGPQSAGVAEHGPGWRSGRSGCGAGLRRRLTRPYSVRTGRPSMYPR